MQNRRLFFLMILLLSGLIGRSQKKELISSYIETYKDIAMEEMKRTGVPASITLAQGIHESGAGASKLVLASNNHFGIKCKSNWAGESVRHDDDAKGECFRKYPQAADSYKDHSDFLKKGQRYAFLFDLDPTDYAGWANGLKQAGYATNPKYPQVLIKLIEEYNLQEYTLIAMGNKQPGEKQELVKKSPGEIEIIPVVVPVEKAEDKPQTIKKIYPSGEFKLNDTKVVFIQQGTSYLAVAKAYDIDLSKIFEFNEMSRAEQVDKDRLIYLQRKRKTGHNDIHIVQPGESLHDIAQAEAIRLESLRELNWLQENDRPDVGEKLNLRSKSTSMPKLAVRENYTLTPAVNNKKTH